MITIGATEVFAALDPGALIAALRAGFLAGATVPERMHCDLAGPNGGGGTLLLMPAWRDGGSLGVKIATVCAGNATRNLPTVFAQYLLLDATTGQPRALIDGRSLTLLRTAAVSALAADVLAAPDARSLTMIGTGALAPHLVRAHATVRQLSDIRLWGRDPDKAGRLAEELRRTGIPARGVARLEDAIDGADIISCATGSTAPLVKGHALAATVHVDLVGGFRPDMREADDAVIERAAIVVDTLSALVECGDLSQPIAAGVVRADRIVPLVDVLRGGQFSSGRCDISLFKSVGTALADLIAAEAVMAIRESEADQRLQHA